MRFVQAPFRLLPSPSFTLIPPSSHGTNSFPFHHSAQRAPVEALAAPGLISTVEPDLPRSRSFTRFTRFAEQHFLDLSEILTRPARGSAAVILRRQFSHSSINMTATKIDGTAIARKIRERLSAQIREQQQTNPRFKPSLTIIQVGDRPDSSLTELGTYVRMKLKAAEEANIICNLVHYPESITELELLEHITSLNNDPSVHGVLVQLPVPEHISEHAVTSAVAEEKDVDGFGVANIGKLAKRGGRPLFLPCTPRGVMVLLQESGVDLKGKNAVVVGRSDIVGGPVSYLLKNADATVTVCHRQTEGLEDFTKRADVVVVAIGKPNYVKGEWLKPGAVVIDVGTNYIPDKSKKSGQRLVGDVDFDSAVEVASQITPVPGGVGPMTVAMLLQNVVDATTNYFEREKARKI